MAACERLAGITGLTIDGNAYMVVSDVTWSPSKWKRETLVGLDSVHGFSEVPLRALSRRRYAIAAPSRSATSMRCAASRSWSRWRMARSCLGPICGILLPLEVRAAEGTFQVRFDGIDVSES